MSDRRPPHLGDELIDLALGHVDAKRRAQTNAHLVACATCRSDYEALSAAVADAVEAVPAMQPPVGFDAAVLARLAPPPRHGRASGRGSGRSWQRWAAAAAVAVGLVVAGALVATRAGDDAATATVVPLRLVDGGRPVGTVSLAEPAGDPVLVVAIIDAPADVSYTCRLRMRDGSVVDSLPWPAVDRGAWIVELSRPLEELHRVDLIVTGTDHVWSSARL